MKFSFSVVDKKRFYKLIDSMGRVARLEVYGDSKYTIELVNSEMNILKSNRCINKVKMFLGSKKPDFLKKVNDTWSTEKFGPVKIPTKGMKITLDSNTVRLYGNIISNYEGSILKHRDGNYYGGKKIIKDYVFNQNYYFVMGDNRHHTVDSRDF